MEIKNFYNVYESDLELFEAMQKDGMYDGDREDFEALEFFEGDPDMLKINGETIYFALYGDNVYFYSAYNDREARGILRDFFAPGKMVHAGYYRYYWPTGKSFSECPQTWDALNRLNCAIAYRGGCGYTYNIFPLRQAA